MNSFHATDLFLRPLKTSENLWLSNVFRGCKERLVACDGLSIWLRIKFYGCEEIRWLRGTNFLYNKKTFQKLVLSQIIKSYYHAKVFSCFNVWLFKWFLKVFDKVNTCSSCKAKTRYDFILKKWPANNKKLA